MTEDLLSAPLSIEYPFTRTTGPVIGAFMTGLRHGMVLGIKRPDGSVLCPPTEYDPQSGQALTEMVEVASEGEVTSWAWSDSVRPQQPFAGPFAWALVRLDGSDTAMLHAVDVADASAMSTGMRVRIRWREDREGHIRDIACFEPIATSAGESR